MGGRHGHGDGVTSASGRLQHHICRISLAPVKLLSRCTATLRRAYAILVLFVLAVHPAFAASATTAEPLQLSKGIYPLTDRSLIGEMRDVQHLLHSPVRREVVLTMDRPWEGKMSAYGKILRDSDGKVRLYYRGGGDIDPPEVTCVAFSDDGVSFVRPSLKLYDIRGTRENNVVFTAAERPSYGESHNFSPFLDTNPAAPAEAKWKAVALKSGEDEHGERRRMLTVLASPDGLRWKHLTDRPVIRTGSFDSLNIAFFDQPRGEYACYFRVGNSGMRSFGRARSKDFVSWTIDDPLTFQPPQDEQWYTNGVTPYPGVPGLYLALPMRFVPQRKTVGDPPRKTDGLSDAVLISSRDGSTWTQTFRGAFIRPGPESANWGNAHGNNTPLAGIIETAAGEWSIYWFEDGVIGTPRIRRGTVRAHGLASIRAGADEGEFVTPLLHAAGASGRSLKLNFSTSAVGSIRVEVLGRDGKPVDRFTRQDCEELYGDEPARIVRWRSGATLPADTPFRLRFLLREADLYALQLE